MKLKKDCERCGHHQRDFASHCSSCGGCFDEMNARRIGSVSVHVLSGEKAKEALSSHENIVRAILKERDLPMVNALIVAFNTTLMFLYFISQKRALELWDEFVKRQSLEMSQVMVKNLEIMLELSNEYQQRSKSNLEEMSRDVDEQL